MFGGETSGGQGTLYGVPIPHRFDAAFAKLLWLLATIVVTAIGTMLQYRYKKTDTPNLS